MRREVLAAQADSCYDYIRRLESVDPPNPTLEKARAICNVLGSTIDEVFPPTRKGR